jgi:hypothetical protein
VSGKMVEGQYSIELVSGDGQGNGLRQVLYRHENLALMRALFKGVSSDTSDSWQSSMIGPVFSRWRGDPIK